MKYFNLNVLTLGFAAVTATAISASASDTAVAEAAKLDRVDQVRALIQEKRDINQPLPDGTTALHWAALNGDISLTRLLLASGAAPGPVSRIGNISPLFTAAQNGNDEIVRALLKRGADANVQTANGATPLMAAAASGSVDTVRALLDHGAKINAADTAHGQTALMYAAARDRGDVIRFLIAHGADPKIASTVVKLGRAQFDDDGNPIGGDPAAGGGAGGGRRRRQPGADNPAAAGTAPAGAIGSDVAGLNLDDLAALGIDVSEASPPRNRPGGKTGGAIATAPSARQSGGNGQNASNGQSGGFSGRGGGFGAGGSGQPGGPGATAGAGRRANAITMGGNTALTLASREGNLEAVQALIASKVDVNEPNAGDKTTPLITAICNGHYDVAKFLVDYGADVNQASIDGLTPLYAVIDAQYAPQTWTPNAITGQEQNTYIDLMNTLIEKGANVNAKLTKKLWFRPTHHDECWIGTAGSTPFWRAAQALDLAAMKLLVSRGADPKIPNLDGDNALMVAAGLGWNGNFTIQAPTLAIDVIKYCLELGLDPTPQDAQGYSAICGAAYRGDIDVINLLVNRGAKLDTRNSKGWSVTDMANGPSLRSSVPVKHPEAVSRLLKLGAPALTPTDDEEILGIIRRKVGQPAQKTPAAP